MCKITTYKEIVCFLKQHGYEKKRQNHGSHQVWSNGHHSVVIPYHNKTFSSKLAYGIQKQVLKKSL